MAGAVLFCWIKRVVETDIIFWYNIMRYAFDKKAYRDRRVTCFMAQSRDELNIDQLNAKEEKREKLVSWYLSLPEIPAKEKAIITKSLRYNVWKSLLRVIIVLFLLPCVWAFIISQYDPFESITGYKLSKAKAVTAVVQEDGMTVLLKNPNKGEHVIYPLAELNIDPTGYKYRDRLTTYWMKEAGSANSYRLVATLPESEVSHIERSWDAFLFISLFAIYAITLIIFFVKRRIYVGWYDKFYDRVEKFCSENYIYQLYPECDTADAFMSYGNDYPEQLVRAFENTQLTAGERKGKRHRIFITVGISAACMAIVVAFIILGTTVKSAIKNRQDEERTAQVLAQIQAAINGSEKPLGAESDYYNYADMLDRAMASFPNEDVYYKLITTDDYVAIVITTDKKTNVYFDRYVPVHGNVGDEGTIYKLDVSMVSNTVQPDDVLNNYTGVLER